MTTPLQKAAQALIEQWDSPGFIVDDEIAELRKALDAELQQSVEPVAWAIECQIMGQQTVREIEGRWKFLQYGDKLYLHPPQQAKQVPMTDDDIYQLAQRGAVNEGLTAIVREVEAHHGITQADKNCLTTDWSAA